MKVFHVLKSMATRDSVLLRKFQYLGNLKQLGSVNLELNVDLLTDFDKACKTDDLNYSINYAVLSRNFKDLEARGECHSNLISLASSMFKDVIFKTTSCDHGVVCLKYKEKSYDFSVELERFKNEQDISAVNIVNDKIKIHNLSLDVIIGIFTFERFQKQPIELNIDIDIDLTQNFIDSKIGESIVDYVSNTNFKTVEALVMNVNKLVYQLAPQAKDVKVQVLKTNIIEFTNVGVQCKRNFEEVKNVKLIEFDKNYITIDKFQLPNLNEETIIQNDGIHTVYLAFGSNLGHQLNNINQAIKELNEHESIKILQTSSLYKSKPMYYLDQEDFINGCLKIETTLTPHELLKVLKSIEYESLKRIKHFDNGPRSIDLDILLYDSIILNTPDLNIPHIRMIERNFVLYPLCDIIPPNFIHPVTAEPIHDHLNQLNPLSKDIQESIDLITIVPFDCVEDFKYMEFDLINNKSKTRLMSILNITPDSFSDGDEANLDLNIIMARVKEMKENNVDIIDIGGCSTRPGSIQPSLETELNRVLPVVKAIKEKYGDEITISVDTYRSQVALESIKLGADIINDISGGTFDDEMYGVIAQTGVPYIVNHTRGDISTMNDLTDYNHSEDGPIKIFGKNEVIVNEIGKEMTPLLEKMYSKGVKRWQLILDPGLGFAKKLKENLNIIRNLPSFKGYSQERNGVYTSFKYIPVLLGPSRKKFIGTITNKGSAIERLNGTSASITASIGFGSDIVRVHDFKEMKDVCLMGDAIYKSIV